MTVSVVGSYGLVGPAPNGLPLPTGTQLGDLLVVVACHWTEPVTVSDSRMTLAHTFHGEFVPAAGVWTGVEDGRGTNIAATVTTDARPSVAVVAIRRAEFGDAAVIESVAPSAVTPLAAPEVSPSKAALVVSIMRTGGVTVGTIARTGDGYTELESESNAGHTNAYLGIWHTTEGSTTSPADSFSFSGSIDGNGVMVIDLIPQPTVAPPLRQLGRRDGLGLIPSPLSLGARSVQRSIRSHGPGTFL